MLTEEITLVLMRRYEAIRETIEWRSLAIVLTFLITYLWTGKLLEAEIVDAEEIIIPPGGKIEKTLEVKESGITIPRQMKIQFTAFGETVLEENVKVEQKAISAEVNSDTTT